MRLIQAELDTHSASIEARQTNGEVVGKPRKKRSDAGITRGKRKQDNKENTGTRPKRSKVSQCAKKVLKGKSKQPSSAEFVYSSNEDEGSQGDGDIDKDEDEGEGEDTK